ncbi:glycoside hydrolase domain-containing protein [Actinomadura sediminis]|uniref:Glycoside hydrolase domain-containing protein n=1 Tax=Actinomadura sediminis TaxID=1038904 RepID=A0ABW3EHK9_9ACTN
MRHVVLLSALSAAAVLAPAGAVLWEAPARPAAGAPAALTAATAEPDRAEPGETGRVVRYRGLSIPVPDGWEVHRLDRDPTRCVRYDRRAVYLGRPGERPDCPARVVGRTSAVHIAPLGDGRSSRTAVRADRLAAFTVERSADHETRLALPEAGVAITGVYGDDPAPLQRVLRGVRLSPSWPGEHAEPGASGEDAPAAGSRRAGSEPPAPGASGGDSADPPDAEPRRPWTRGRGFDTCTAPSLDTMARWRDAFEVTNIYIGGAARGCAQPNLTEAWVREVRAMGYRITPTYVGLQAPCGPRPQRFTKRKAAEQGRENAVDAARKARELGIPPGEPIYLDMEAYDGRKKGCRKAVLDFIDAWVGELEKQGYRPCMYSSAASGVRDVARASGINKPDGIWFANWDGRASVYGDPHFPDDLWSPHRRIKQYRGPHKERHGGVTLNIDSNVVDGYVY